MVDGRKVRVDEQWFAQCTRTVACMVETRGDGFFGGWTMRDECERLVQMRYGNIGTREVYTDVWGSGSKVVTDPQGDEWKRGLVDRMLGEAVRMKESGDVFNAMASKYELQGV